MTTFVHFGSASHGVTRYGRLLAEAVARHIPVRRVDLAIDQPEDLSSVHCGPNEVLHLQYSDSLHVNGGHRLASVLHQVPNPIVVTLHDVPGLAGEAPERTTERASHYREIVHAAQRVVVCSEHEARAVAAWSGVRPHVVPHLVEDRSLRRPVDADQRIGILGYVYPGKGHELAIDACALLGWTPGVVALGGTTLHSNLVQALHRRADDAGVAFEVTGYLCDDDFDDALHRTLVPVVTHRSPSASGSLASWLSAGRRPIATANGYTSEIATDAPHCLHLVAPNSPNALATEIRRLIEQPARSRNDRGHPWSVDRIGDLHLPIYQRLLPPSHAVRPPLCSRTETV